MTVERTAVDPVKWSVEMGFNQGEVVSRHTLTLCISGQTAMNSGGMPQHEGDMAAQLTRPGDTASRLRLVRAEGQAPPGVAPPLAGGGAVGLAEAAGEVAGMGEPPGAGNGFDGAVGMLGGGQVVASAFEPSADDPFFEAQSALLAQPVEGAHGDAVRQGDALRREVRLGQVRAEVGQDAGDESFLGHLPAGVVRAGQS